MKKHFFVLAAVIFSNQLIAQRFPARQEDSTITAMDEVVLTANKYPQKQSATGKVMTVINRQQLDRSAGQSLAELLNAFAGITIPGANNNAGTNLSVSIRGSSAGNVLILLDGIPVNDPSVISNYYDLNFIAPDQVERIEILKGGQSTLYGSDAVAGVINIISKKGGKKKIQYSGDLSGGSYNTFKQSAGILGKAGPAEYSVQYSHLSTNGFSSAYDKNNTGLFDKDGFDQHTVSGRLAFRAGKKITIALTGNFSQYHTDLDASAFTDEKDHTATNKNGQAGLGAVYTLKKGTLHFNYHYNRAGRDYLDDSLDQSSPWLTYAKSNYVGRTQYAEWYGNWKLSNWDLLVGTDYRMNNTQQSYWSTGPFGPYAPPVLEARMNQLSPYASLQYMKKDFTLEFGSRLNLHSEYGSNMTFTFNPSYRLNKKVKLFGNLYTAFKTPTLYQLFDPSAGNRDLQPEKGVIAETGAELFAVRTFKARAVIFYRDTKNAILYTYNPATFESKYLNSGNQTNYGVELETACSFRTLTLSANYTYTDGKTRSAFDGTGKPLGKDSSYFNLYRIPKYAINFEAGWQLTHKLFTRVQLHANSKREEFIYGSSPEILKAYTTIDVYGEYKMGEKAKIFLTLRNITNQRYFDFLGYTAKRFNYMTGIQFQF